MIAFADPASEATQIAERLTGRSYLSWSAISTFLRCPLKYRYHYLDQLPEEFVSSNLVFGAAIHAALETHFNAHLSGHRVHNLDALMDVYRETWEQRDLKQVLFGKSEDRLGLEQLATRMLDVFLQNDISNPGGSIIGIEEEFQASVIPGCPDLFARLDLMMETDDSIVVTDFKTARSRWSAGDAIVNEGQLLLYHELIQQWAGKPIRLQFAIITKTKQPELELRSIVPNPTRIQRLHRLIQRVWAAVQAGNFYPVASAMNCPTCGYRDRCAHWNG